ncbi:hypothetical protein ACIQYS_09820 [Psychrobacillus sp. NPDC096426]|uniref:hypothetical protein n=1 Tax=Psychrobacillus sp. NPDC096426 TaxID=3364491 RepID=UPI0037F25F0A
MNENAYTLINFVDHILKIDENSEFIPKRDDSGNVIINKITGRPELVAEQEGTRLNAINMNHMDLGIYSAHELIVTLQKLVLRLQLQLELDGRAPGNSGSFADTFDGTPNKLIRQTASATLTAPRASGTTVLNVDATEGFKAFTQVTIYDGANSEDTLITDVTASTITVQPLVNDYVKGAVIARSNAVIEDSQLVVGSWGTYDISLGEVV